MHNPGVLDGLTRAAFDEARVRGHHWVGIEHLLLVLTREPPGTVVGHALAACGVTEADVAGFLAARGGVPARPPGRGEAISPNPAFYGVCGFAEGFALAQQALRPRPEHYLLALVWSSSDSLLKALGTTPAAIRDALAKGGATVPASNPPLPPEFGESVEVSATELPVLLDRLDPLLSPPLVTVAVSRDDDRASVMAHPSIDLRQLLEEMRAKA